MSSGITTMNTACKCPKRVSLVFALRLSKTAILCVSLPRPHMVLHCISSQDPCQRKQPPCVLLECLFKRFRGSIGDDIILLMLLTGSDQEHVHFQGDQLTLIVLITSVYASIFMLPSRQRHIDGKDSMQSRLFLCVPLSHAPPFSLHTTSLEGAYFVSRQSNGTAVYHDVLPSAGSRFIDMSQFPKALGFELPRKAIAINGDARDSTGSAEAKADALAARFARVIGLDFLLEDVVARVHSLDFERFLANDKMQPLHVVVRAFFPGQAVDDALISSQRRLVIFVLVILHRFVPPSMVRAGR